MDSVPGTTRRTPSAWRIGAWVGALLTAFSFFTSGWRDALGFALATIGMFVSAREDFNAKSWTKLAASALVIAAVAVWVLL
jgi:hypothetical protein